MLNESLAAGAFKFSGEFAFSMGFAAMFSISGGTMIVLPGVMGVCVYSPRVDTDSLSVFGLRFAQIFAERVQCHRFGALPGLEEQLHLLDPTLKRSVYQVLQNPCESLLQSPLEPPLPLILSVGLTWLLQNANVAKMLDAASSGDRKLMKQLMTIGVSPAAMDYDKRTALHLAASENQISLIKFMIKQMQASTRQLGEAGIKAAQMMQAVNLNARDR